MLLRNLEDMLIASRFPREIPARVVVNPGGVRAAMIEADSILAATVASVMDSHHANVVDPVLSPAARLLDMLGTDEDLDAELEAAVETLHARAMAASAASESMPELVQDYLAGPVADQDRAPSAHRYSEDSNYIHVSALVDMCPRAYALARQNDVVIYNSPSGAMRIVWEMGLALEAHVVRQMRVAFGGENVASQMTLRDDEYMIVGRPDSLVNMTPHWNVVVEIKTMEAVGFGRLTQPLANHVLQSLLYRWLAERSGLQVHDEVILLYVAKDFVRGGVYKEYHVNHRDVACQNMLNLALELAMELKRAMDRDGVPARRICDVAGCRRARGCPVATLCFNTMAEAT